MNIEEWLTSNIEVVKHYPYRTGRVMNNDQISRVHFQRGDGADKLHQALCEKLGYHATDNHECFLVLVDGQEHAIQFSDWTCYIGIKVTEGGW